LTTRNYNEILGSVIDATICDMGNVEQGDGEP